MAPRANTTGWLCFGCGSTHDDAMPFALSLTGGRFCPATYFRLLDRPQASYWEQANMTEASDVIEVSAEPVNGEAEQPTGNDWPTDPQAFQARAADLQRAYAAKRRNWYKTRRQISN